MTGFSEPHKGLVFALLAAVFFTCLDISIRFSGSELTVWHLVFGRSLFGVAAMWLLARKLGVELLGRESGIARKVDAITIRVASVYGWPEAVLIQASVMEKQTTTAIISRRTPCPYMIFTPQSCICWASNTSV